MTIGDLKQLLKKWEYEDDLRVEFLITLYDEYGNIAQESIEEVNRVSYIKDLTGNEDNSLRFEIYVTMPNETE